MYVFVGEAKGCISITSQFYTATVSLRHPGPPTTVSGDVITSLLAVKKSAAPKI